MNAVQPGEHLLDQQLGFAVGVGGEQPRIFLNRNGLQARRRRRRWRRKPAGGGRGPAWPQAARAWRRCCCGRRSSGWTMDSPASMRAAKWRTASKGGRHWGCDEKVFKGRAGQPARPEQTPRLAATGRAGRGSGCQKRRAWCPFSASSPATVPPMYPAPPVTNIFTKKTVLSRALWLPLSLLQ